MPKLKSSKKVAAVSVVRFRPPERYEQVRRAALSQNMSINKFIERAAIRHAAEINSKAPAISDGR